MASNKSYNSQSYENLKTLDSIYCQLCRITNSKQFEDSMYDYLPHEIDIDINDFDYEIKGTII